MPNKYFLSNLGFIFLLNQSNYVLAFNPALSIGCVNLLFFGFEDWFPSVLQWIVEANTGKSLKKSIKVNFLKHVARMTL